LALPFFRVERNNAESDGLDSASLSDTISMLFPSVG
jgi:hypothetical protein